MGTQKGVSCGEKDILTKFGEGWLDSPEKEGQKSSLEQRDGIDTCTYTTQKILQSTDLTAANMYG